MLKKILAFYECVLCRSASLTIILVIIPSLSQVLNEIQKQIYTDWVVSVFPRNSKLFSMF